LWGNGEHAWKLLRSVGLFLMVIAVAHGWWSSGRRELDTYLYALTESPQIFVGSLAPPLLPRWILASIVFVRLLTIGLFTSILVKRLNRR
jgi:hypothetical protein